MCGKCFKRDYYVKYDTHDCCPKQYNYYNCCQPIINDTFRAYLDGRNEIPPNNSLATGNFNVKLSIDETRLKFKLRTRGLRNIISAHFHLGNINENGPIVKTIPIDLRTGDAVGTWTATDSEPLTPQLVARLKTGGLYVNVHTTLYPDGEIRGQIFPVNCRLSNISSNSSNGIYLLENNNNVYPL